MRGIAYEQAGDWERAEKDLKAALAFRPDHPYVLNYLGYAWADQGINLQESLKMIRRARGLRPRTGISPIRWAGSCTGSRITKTLCPCWNARLNSSPTIRRLTTIWVMPTGKPGGCWKAKFQWRRAKNHAEDEEQAQKIQEKLESGIGD